MTGVELAEEIHKINPDIPVILCTGFSNSINSLNFKSKGISALILKPVEIKELAEVIRRVLDKKF
jgi:CheY-like chemotaxis protein